MTGTGEQNARGRLPEGVPSGPTSPVAPGRHSAGTGLGENVPVPGTPRDLCSVCGRKLLYHYSGTEGGLKRTPYCPIHSTRETRHLR